MTTLKAQNTKSDTQKVQDSLVDSVKILSDITRRDIEKLYSIDNTNGTEAYYSNRYGWTLRKTID